jgi:thioredoxin-dependent peroxiredoxin
VVIGVSIDKLADQQKFTAKEKLNFPLYADQEREVAKKFGVLKGSYAQRVTFVIDKKGIVRKIYPKVNLKNHPDEVLTFVKENLATKS